MWLLEILSNEFIDLAMEISSLQQIVEVPKEIREFLKVTRFDNRFSKGRHDQKRKSANVSGLKVSTTEIENIKCMLVSNLLVILRGKKRTCTRKLNKYKEKEGGLLRILSNFQREEVSPVKVTKWMKWMKLNLKCIKFPTQSRNAYWSWSLSYSSW